MTRSLPRHLMLSVAAHSKSFYLEGEIDGFHISHISRFSLVLSEHRLLLSRSGYLGGYIHLANRSYS